METLRRYAKDFISIALVILTLILLLNTYSILKLSKEVNEIVEKNKEAEKPADVKIALLDCSTENCAELDEDLSQLKLNTRLNIEEEKSYTLETAKDLISKYSIKKLPAIIVIGSDLDKLSLQGYTKSDNALILETNNAPYQDALTGKIVGLVTSMVISEPSCKECPDLSVVVSNLERAGVAIPEKKLLQYDEAKDLLAKYNVTKLPTLILSEEFSNYELSNNWKLLGHVTKDGNYILDLQAPPYYDTGKNEVIGLVSVTMISDLSCTKCYNATQVHLPIIKRFGVYIKEEKTLDLSSDEAKKLISKYNITSIPTILLSKEAKEYNALVKAWQDVGTIESDNFLVFRENDLIGLTYKDLKTGKVVEPAPQDNA